MSTKEKKKAVSVGRRVQLPLPVDIPTISIAPALLDDVRSLIDSARLQTARAVNSAMVVTYWSIGERIRREVLGDDRAEYGKQVVERLAEHLSGEYGSEFSRQPLPHDAVRGGVSLGSNCRDTVATIELVACG